MRHLLRVVSQEVTRQAAERGAYACLSHKENVSQPEWLTIPRAKDESKALRLAGGLDLDEPKIQHPTEQCDLSGLAVCGWLGCRTSRLSTERSLKPA